jgi:hypothetical protein
MNTVENDMSDIPNKATTILLICREGQSRQIYQKELNIPGVLLVSVQTLMQFFRKEIYCPLNGILVDMPTFMRCSEEEKRILTDLVGLFPALRLKCHEPTGEIRTLPFGTVYKGDNTPAVFVQNYCASFSQRLIRTCERTLVNIPALLSTHLPMDEVSGQKTVTAALSRKGCFLISFEQWNTGDPGWLILTELKDRTPISVEVRSVRTWGEYRSLPGIGVRFIDFTASQKAELSKLGGPNLMQDNE